MEQPATERKSSSNGHSVGDKEALHGVAIHRVRSTVENEVQLERNFSFLSSLGLAFTLLSSWTAM